MVTVKRFEVWLVGLDPATDREIKKTRPCVIISPDELALLATVVVAPLTSKGFVFPGRVAAAFEDKQGLILLDQMRAVAKKRLYKKLGAVDAQAIETLCATLQEFFAC